MKIELKQISPPPAPPPPKRYALNLELDYAELCLLRSIVGKVGGVPDSETTNLVTQLYYAIGNMEHSIPSDCERLTVEADRKCIYYADLPKQLAAIRAKHP